MRVKYIIIPATVSKIKLRRLCDEYNIKLFKSRYIIKEANKDDEISSSHFLYEKDRTLYEK